MPRQVPLIQPPIHEKKTPAISMTRNYTLLTPMFGGGVKPRHADEITPIRGSAIRGQLRFWWRATRGGQFGGDLARMKSAEEAIFGCAAEKGKEGGPSKVNITTRLHINANRTPKISCFDGDHNENAGPPYADFPLRPQQGQKLPWKFVQTVDFQVTISCLSIEKLPEDLEKELEATFWAWETFGGIGARTRRGFGAIANMQEAPKSNTEIEVWMKSNLQKHITETNFPNLVPHLDPNMRIVFIGGSNPQTYNDASSAWNDLITRLKNFRNSQMNPWPEPKIIKQLYEVPKQTKEIYPRAGLGLPIIFQFKDDAYPRATLAPKNDDNKYTRMASPLILRPVKIAQNKFIAMAVFLKVSGTDMIELNLDFNNTNFPASPDISKTQQLPGNVQGKKHVVDAFLDSLARRS